MVISADALNRVGEVGIREKKGRERASSRDRRWSHCQREEGRRVGAGDRRGAAELGVRHVDLEEGLSGEATGRELDMLG